MMYTVRYMERGKANTGDFIGTEMEIRGKLAQDGKVVLSMRPAQTIFDSRVHTKEVEAVLTALGELTKVGVPLSQAMETVALSLSSKSRMKSIFLTVQTAVGEGKSLPDTMAGFPQIFGSTVVSIVRAGVATGTLSQSLLLAAAHLRKIAEIKSQMVKKLAYPVSILLFGLGSMALNSLFVIPKLINSDMFKLVGGGEVNIFIKILQWSSVVMPFFIGAIAVAGFFLAAFFKTHQEAIERMLFMVGPIRRLVFSRSYYVTFFSLASLLKAGVPLATALEIARSGTGVKTIQHELEDCLMHLNAGESFVRGLNHLTHIERTMLEVATNSDMIHENLMEIANGFYGSYLEQVQGLSPKIYAFVMVFVLSTFLMTFMGIFMPYTKILGGIK